MIQRMPDPGGLGSDRDEESWRRAAVFMASCTSAELLDAELSPEGLLYRLFHEDGVRAFRKRSLRFACRCSRERVADMLGALPKDDIEEIKENQTVVTANSAQPVTFSAQPDCMKRRWSGAVEFLERQAFEGLASWRIAADFACQCCFCSALGSAPAARSLSARITRISPELICRR